MKLDEIRSQALAFPEVTEEPHFNYSTFRVRGKIFMTAPPGGSHAHFFVQEEAREKTLALQPEFAEKLLWSKKVVGLRVTLARANPLVVGALVCQAWRNKARRTLADSDGV